MISQFNSYTYIPVNGSMHGVAEHRQPRRHGRKESPFVLILLRTPHRLPQNYNSNHQPQIEFSSFTKKKNKKEQRNRNSTPSSPRKLRTEECEYYRI